MDNGITLPEGSEEILTLAHSFNASSCGCGDMEMALYRVNFPEKMNADNAGVLPIAEIYDKVKMSLSLEDLMIAVEYLHLITEVEKIAGSLEGTHPLIAFVKINGRLLMLCRGNSPIFFNCGLLRSSVDEIKNSFYVLALDGEVYKIWRHGGMSVDLNTDAHRMNLHIVDCGLRQIGYYTLSQLGAETDFSFEMCFLDGVALFEIHFGDAPMVLSADYLRSCLRCEYNDAASHIGCDPRSVYNYSNLISAITKLCRKFPGRVIIPVVYRQRSAYAILENYRDMMLFNCRTLAQWEYEQNECVGITNGTCGYVRIVPDDKFGIVKVSISR